MNHKLIGKLIVALFSFTLLIGSVALANFNVLNMARFNTQESPYKASNFKQTYLDNGIPTEIRLKKAHNGMTMMTVKQNKNTVYEVYLTEPERLSWMQRIQDKDSSRIFYAFSGQRYAEVYGYDPVQKTWQKYIDAMNYYSGYDFPGIILNVKDHELELHFFLFGKDGSVPNHIYRLFWDSKANWFGYQDMGYFKYYDGKNHKL